VSHSLVLPVQKDAENAVLVREGIEGEAATSVRDAALEEAVLSCWLSVLGLHDSKTKYP
jgi:hypothetical protein